MLSKLIQIYNNVYRDYNSNNYEEIGLHFFSIRIYHDEQQFYLGTDKIRQFTASAGFLHRCTETNGFGFIRSFY